MNIKAFFVDVLTSALDLGVAAPDDVVRHVTPALLAAHLPRPLWARLLTACIGAPRVDARIVVETVGVSNLCEHIPATVLWSCIAELGARSLGTEFAVRIPPPPPAVSAAPLAITSPPAPEAKPQAPPAPTVVVGTSIPTPSKDAKDASVPAAREVESRPASSRARTQSQRFRSTNTNMGRLAATNGRRPQAQAQAEAPAPSPTTDPAPGAAKPPRRIETDVEIEAVTEVGSANREDWRNALAVEDEQLVDWAAADETLNSDVDGSGRKH